MAGVGKAWISAANRHSAPGLTGEVADLIRSVRTLVADRYHPELHYMRGPGPKWHAKHDPKPAVADDHAVPALARVN